jgi:hypothetical protein
MFTKALPAAAATLGFFLAQALPASACGGLVAPNGSVRLERATTLVDWHDGVEHYMTSFTYQGNATNIGWIVPLPAVPDKIEEGGAWSLQRLFRETHPQPPFLLESLSAADLAGSAEVLQQVQVEALDITVLRGSGQAILDWAAKDGFAIDVETRDHLIVYAKGSPIFMAAKYNTARAQARRQIRGDGAPVLITMKTPHPWIPFEVLGVGTQQVQADLYLITDKPVNTSEWRAVAGVSGVGTTVNGAPGFTLEYQEQMNPSLFHDLSTDRNMSWVRPDGWLTYMSLDSPSQKVTYDMSVSPMGVVKIAQFGTAPMAIIDGANKAANLPTAPLGTPQAALILVVVLGLAAFVLRRRRAEI